METHKVVDYAENVINIKRVVKDFEKAAINKDWELALELAVQITVESRLLGQNVKLLNDNRGSPYQVVIQQSETV